MHVSDAALLPSAEPVALGNPHFCRSARSATRQFKANRPCFTAKRPSHCSTIRSQSPTNTVAAATALSTQQGTPRSAVQGQLRNAELQRQLEASYLARSADQIDGAQPLSSTADSEVHAAEDYARLERSWQQQQASTSGRADVVNTLSALPSKPARRRNVRTRRRLSRIHSPGTQQSSTEQQPDSTQCPDAQFCALIRQQLESERARRRISRSLAQADAVSMFLYDLGNATLLSRQQEGQLSKIYQKGIAQEDAISQLAQNLNREPSEAEIVQHLGYTDPQQVLQIQSNAREAMQLMTSFNLRLVFSMCKKFTGRGVDFADLIPEGTTGMVKAIEKFDADKGFKFSTYAHWWIRQSLSRCIVNQSRTIRVPVHVHDIVAKIYKTRTRLAEQPGRQTPPSYQEIGAELGLAAAKVKTLLKQVEPARSLDGPAYTSQTHKDDSDMQDLVDIVAAEPLQPEEPVETKAKDSVNTLLSTLLPRERNVIRMRYGLHDAKGTCMTFNDIGAAYGLSKERVRQIEDKALTKLRNPARKKLLQAAGH